MWFKTWLEEFEEGDPDAWKSGTEYASYKGMTVADIVKKFSLKPEHGWSPEWISYYFTDPRLPRTHPDPTSKYNLNDYYEAYDQKTGEYYDLSRNPEAWSKPVGWFWQMLEGTPSFPSQKHAISWAIDQGFDIKKNSHQSI